MMLSRLIDQLSRRLQISLLYHQQRYRSRLCAGFDRARRAILSSAMPLPTVHWHLNLRRSQDQLLRLRRASLSHSHAMAKSP